MRLIYIEVSPMVVRACNGAGSFRMMDPEPILVQMLESPNAVYSPLVHGPASLHLLVLATEKYITVMEEAVSRHEIVRLKYSKAGDDSSMEAAYNILRSRLQKAKYNLALFQEAACVATSPVASCN